MKKLVYLLVLVVLVSGCATTANYEAKLNTWVGYNESSLIASWGAPQNAYQMADGKRVIEYIQSANVPIGGYTYTKPQTTYHRGMVGGSLYSGTSTQYVTEQTPTYNMQLWCKTSFIIDTNGRIESWRWEGNNCVSY
ncbi:MAG: lipoprotein [Candidatus Omnitrophota bacterium]